MERSDRIKKKTLRHTKRISLIKGIKYFIHTQKKNIAKKNFKKMKDG